MSYKLRVSKPNKNVLTETSLDNIVYDSDYDTLKYYSAGTVTLNVNGSSKHGTVSHSLGYKPFFVTYVDKLSPTDTWSMCPQTFNDGFTYLYASSYADSNKIYFDIETNAATNTFNFYYKIFRNDTGI